MEKFEDRVTNTTVNENSILEWRVNHGDRISVGTTLASLRTLDHTNLIRSNIDGNLSINVPSGKIRHFFDKNKTLIIGNIYSNIIFKISSL